MFQGDVRGPSGYCSKEPATPLSDNISHCAYTARVVEVGGKNVLIGSYRRDVLSFAAFKFTQQVTWNESLCGHSRSQRRERSGPLRKPCVSSSSVALPYPGRGRHLAILVRMRQTLLEQRTTPQTSQTLYTRALMPSQRTSSVRASRQKKRDTMTSW